MAPATEAGAESILTELRSCGSVWSLPPAEASLSSTAFFSVMDGYLADQMEGCLSDLAAPGPPPSPGPGAGRTAAGAAGKHAQDLWVPVALPVQTPPLLLPIPAVVPWQPEPVSQDAPAPVGSGATAAHRDGTQEDAAVTLPQSGIPQVAFQVRLVPDEARPQAETGGTAAPAKSEAAALSPPSPSPLTTAETATATAPAAMPKENTVDLPRAQPAPPPAEPVSQPEPNAGRAWRVSEQPDLCLHPAAAPRPPAPPPATAPANPSPAKPGPEAAPAVIRTPATRAEPVASARPTAAAGPATVKPPAKPAAGSRDTSGGDAHNPRENSRDNPNPVPVSAEDFNSFAGSAPAAAPAPAASSVGEPSVPATPAVAESSPALHSGAQAPPAAPATHDVALRLSDGQNNVDIRMAERAGEIRVTVQTTDHDLASSLRTELPDLVGKLRQNGFQAEVWRPAANSSPADDSRHGGGGERGSQPDSAGARRDGRQPPNQQQPRNPSRWAAAWQSRRDPAPEAQI
ncbi:MAG TPA: hypothetical protein VMI94_07160 [Bryobacteraceae bacterium]|nr:hypothetical protein [Bryobacteraceae bacterium]